MDPNVVLPAVHIERDMHKFLECGIYMECFMQPRDATFREDFLEVNSQKQGSVPGANQAVPMAGSRAFLVEYDFLALALCWCFQSGCATVGGFTQAA